MKFQHPVLLFVLILILITACAGPIPTPGATADWQTYTDPKGEFSIQYPSTWKLETLPDQNNGALHGVSMNGDEGGVELYWGIGLGGACTPEAMQNIKVAQGELPTCYGKNPDGTEHWENISTNLSAESFSARAYTADATSGSHDLVLQVISTLSFP